MQRKKFNFLEDLSAIQIDDLIEEVKLESQGFQFIYSIDPFDIQNYCFPLGIIPDEERLDAYDLNYLTQENAALYYLFELHKFPIIILDEYIDELIGFKLFVEGKKTDANNIVHTLNLFKENIKHGHSINFDDLKEAHGILSENFSLIVAIAADIIHPGIEKFNHLLETERFIIDYTELNELIANDSSLDNFKYIFETVFPGDLTKKLYEFIKNNKEASDFRSFDQWLVNKYNDSKIFDRVININKKLQTKLDNKCILIYVSSASSFNGVIKHKSFRDLFPEINGKKFNIHRNTAQVYLKLLTDSDNIEETIRALESFKKFVSWVEPQSQIENHFNSNYHWELTAEIVSNIENRKFKILNEITVNNLRITEKAKIIRTLLQEAKKKDQIKLLSFLNDETITKLFSKYGGSINKAKQQTLLFSRLNGEQQYLKLLIEGFKRITNGESDFKINQGNDLIGGSSHHLPLIYFLLENKYQCAIDEIAENTIDYDRHYAREINDDTQVHKNKLLVNNLKLVIENNVLDTFNKETVIATTDELITRYVIGLILPLPNKGFRDNNLFVENKVTEYLLLNNEIHKNLTPKEIKNLKYIEIWIKLRKDNRVSFELINEIIALVRTYPEDPRFYHALGLSYYCQTQTIDLQINKKKELLKKSLTQFEKAFSKYKSHDFNSLKLKQFVLNEILNSQCYINTLLYCEDNKELESLYKARLLIKELKKIDDDFESVAEFLHTEAFLLFIDYSVFKSSGEFKEIKLDRLEQAHNRIRRAISLKRKGIYELLKYEIEDEIFLINRE